jgi:hypothetical protein
MQPRLDRDELAQRFRRQASDLIIQIASLLQGGVLSAAAFSLIAIFQAHDDVEIRVMLWLISMALGLVMFFVLCHRALFLMHAGVEVLFMLPLMCLLEIVLFAVLSTTELAADGWRYWYVPGVCLFASGVVANTMSLRSMKAEHYAEDAMVVFATQRRAIRRECIEAPSPRSSQQGSASGYLRCRRIGPTQRHSSFVTWRLRL